MKYSKAFLISLGLLFSLFGAACTSGSDRDVVAGSEMYSGDFSLTPAVQDHIQRARPNIEDAALVYAKDSVGVWAVLTDTQECVFKAIASPGQDVLSASAAQLSGGMGCSEFEYVTTMISHGTSEVGTGEGEVLISIVVLPPSWESETWSATIDSGEILAITSRVIVIEADRLPIRVALSCSCGDQEYVIT